MTLIPIRTIEIQRQFIWACKLINSKFTVRAHGKTSTAPVRCPSHRRGAHGFLCVGFLSSVNTPFVSISSGLEMDGQPETQPWPGTCEASWLLCETKDRAQGVIPPPASQAMRPFACWNSIRAGFVRLGQSIGGWSWPRFGCPKVFAPRRGKIGRQSSKAAWLWPHFWVFF